MSQLIRHMVWSTAVVMIVSGCGTPAHYEIVLAGGTVIDGTGAPARVADVAITDGRITAIEPNILPDQADRWIDVSGRVVSPGFWDNHAHLVTLRMWPDAENFVRQGITTILAPLHSQDQPFPLDEYRKNAEIGPNVGLFAGHTWIRKRVMGLENRAPTPEELSWMVALVDSSMQQGALGFSTGLEYVPAIFADTDEIVALAEIAADYGGIYVTHMRDEGVRVLESIAETLEVGRRASIPVQVNHHKVTGAANWGMTKRTLAMLDSAANAGQEVAHDVYPYTAYSTYGDLLFPSWALADGPDAFRARIADPAVRARLVEEMMTIFPQQTGGSPESIQFREVADQPELQGRTLADYLNDLGREQSLEETVNTVIELQAEGGFIGVFEGMSEEDVVRIMRHPTAMFETDGDLVQPGVGFPHPRSYGSFPRILAKYVREDGVMTLEEAIYKMTALPARWLGTTERGTLEVGMIADVTVFHPDEVQDHARYTDPHHYSTGIEYVLVNGVLILEQGHMTGARPGTFLERSRSR